MSEHRLLEGLNAAQREAVIHEAGPLLIVAGAGTGKTTVLTRRYAYLLDQKKLKTSHILAVTFTEKAATEMEDRVLELLPNGTYDFWISTFHGFCQRILEKYGLEIGLPTQFRLLNDTDSWLLLKRHLADLPLNIYRPLGNPVKFLSALLRHFSRAKDEGMTPEMYQEMIQRLEIKGEEEFIVSERARLNELAACYMAYRDLLRREGALDFGDLMLESLRLVKERPGVLQELREQFRSILVDEFQDTNWAQYELIRLLAGKESNLTVVGDDDQAIYKFRGASLANILQFRDDYPEAKTVALTQNYRSHQEILDASYRFIAKNNPNRLEVRLADTGLNKRLESSKGGGGKVVVRWFATLEDEADGIVQTMIDLKTTDPNLTWSDFAILSRSNDGVEPFLIALERQAIPYRFLALRGLYAKPLIVDVVAMLSLLDGMPASTDVWRTMTSSAFQFPPTAVAAFLGYANRKGVALWQALRDAAVATETKDQIETIRQAERLLGVFDALALTAHRERPLKVVQLLIEKTGTLSQILSLPEGEKLESIGHLNGFLQRVKRYELSTLAPTLHGFLDDLQIEIESGEEGALSMPADAGPDLVQVMTVHASKGLEFKHVFIVSMVDQRFPTRERSEAIPLPDGMVNERLPEGDVHVEEERRLLYVAMTRAKETCTLSGAQHYGGTRKKKPSVFLAEAGFEVDTKVNELDASKRLIAPTDFTTQDQAEREVFQLKRRFSFTQLAAFRNCPLQYKFAHLYRIPILGSFQKSYGQSIHRAFHAILAVHAERSRAKQVDLFSVGLVEHPSTGFRVSAEEAIALFEEAWIDEWYDDRAHHDKMKQEGRQALERMMQIWTAEPPVVAFLEQSFDWRIGEHSIRGAVDRMDVLPEGGYLIYDYKTGSPKTDESLEKNDKEQLWLYQCAMEERGLAIKQLKYVYVRTGQTAEVPILQGTKRDDFKTELEARMKEILLSRFSPSPSPFTCQYCDFNKICEWRKR